MKKNLILSGLVSVASLYAYGATPVPSDITAAADGDDVIVRWTAPEGASQASVTESFEEYETFVKDKAGEWSFIDGDGKPMQPYYDYVKDNGGIVHFDEEWAWQVMSDEPFPYPTVKARTGNNVLCTFVCFNGMDESLQNDDWAISPLLSGTAQTITLYMAQIDSYAEAEPIEFMYSASGNKKEDFTLVEEVKVNGENWQEFSFSVPDGAAYFAIVYKGTAANYGVRVDDVTYVPAGSASLDLKGYNLYRDGSILNDEPLQATEYTDEDAAGESHVYKVACVFEDGEGDSSVEVKYKSLLPPAPKNFVAMLADGNIALSWEEPDGPMQTTDGFEDYEAFNPDVAGEWTFVDGDKKMQSAPYDSYETMDLTHDGEFWAWQVMDPAPFKEEESTNLKTRNGNNILCTFALWGGRNDDWAISPALSGDKQKIAFYVSSYIASTLEPLELLYSTTGTSPEDFELVEEIKTTGMWTRHEFEVPQGARYFAFHYTGSSDDNYGLKIDDVSFYPEGEKEYSLTGFNVYRDGEKINEKPVEDYAYVDENASAGLHLYQVSAVYEEGESGKVSCSIDNTGNSTEMSVAEFSVSAGQGVITVRGAEAVAVYNVDGTRVASASGDCTLKVSPGLYIVSTDKGNVKTIVR